MTSIAQDLREAEPSVELWGGHECTVNRVGDSWFDQTLRSGHEHRLGDLALFADLGICKLRYPVLWERIAPERPEQRDFRWTDERLPEIRRLGMEPILTLCHHGSGPRYTSLLADNFAPGLADHAAAVAGRYPWATYYTPVNEPLTTARFSALYGFWYPHLREERAFWTALLNETDATRLAMRAIRMVNPAALLVQTDDLGFCHASPPLQRNADFQNERRWMGWDLLCGMVIPGHALWERLVSCGLEDRLRTIAKDPCPPDIIGVNHYLSSERFLDHRIERHGNRAAADQAVGECDGVAHVDVDAIRHLPDEVIGLAGLVEQAWERYGIPVAITECHHGSTREEQARWFIEAWRDAQALRSRDVDIRAVTAWSLIGSFDWDRMVTRSVGHYEPGVFDLRHGTPRPTMMAGVLEDLANGRHPTGPALRNPGWWCRGRQRRSGNPSSTQAETSGDEHPLLIIGDAGVFTRLVAQACDTRGLPYVLSDALDEHARTIRPWAVLDARNPTSETGSLPALQSLCTQLSIGGALMSAPGTVRDGSGSGNMLIIESGPLFTADDDAGLPVTLIDALDAGGDALEGEGALWQGIYGPSLVDNVLDLLLDGVTGSLLFASKYFPAGDLAVTLASIAGSSHEAVKAHELERSSDSPTTGYLPCLQTMLERFVRDRRWMRSRQNCQAELETRRVESAPKPRQKDLALAAWFEEDAFWWRRPTSLFF